MFIKIIDDTIEKRELSYMKKLTFVLKRLEKRILASIITVLPIMIAFSLLNRYIPSMLIVVATLVYVMMLIFFRLLFTFIAYGILVFVIVLIIKDTSGFLNLLKVIVNALLSLYSIVFVTTLYKQVSEKPHKDEEYELECFEEA